MEVSKVTLDDGRACASLIKFLTHGRWELSGAEAETLMRSKKWVHDLAMKMAGQLQASESSKQSPQSVPQTGFKVKAMGPIATSNSKKKNRKR